MYITYIRDQTDTYNLTYKTQIYRSFRVPIFAVVWLTRVRSISSDLSCSLSRSPSVSSTRSICLRNAARYPIDGRGTRLRPKLPPCTRFRTHIYMIFERESSIMLIRYFKRDSLFLPHPLDLSRLETLGSQSLRIDPWEKICQKIYTKRCRGPRKSLKFIPF